MRWTSRIARPTSRAAANMVSTLISRSTSPVSALRKPSVTIESTDWATDRLPAEAKPIARSPGVSNRWSLRNVAMLSTPALVRVSPIITSPSRTRMPTQYVMAYA